MTNITVIRRESAVKSNKRPIRCKSILALCVVKMFNADNKFDKNTKKTILLLAI